MTSRAASAAPAQIPAFWAPPPILTELCNSSGGMRLIRSTAIQTSQCQTYGRGHVGSDLGQLFPLGLVSAVDVDILERIRQGGFDLADFFYGGHDMGILGRSPQKKNFINR